MRLEWSQIRQFTPLLPIYIGHGVLWLHRWISEDLALLGDVSSSTTKLCPGAFKWKLLHDAGRNRARLPTTITWPHCLLSVQLWAHHLTTVCWLSFLICKMGIIIVPASVDLWGLNELIYTEHLSSAGDMSVSYCQFPSSSTDPRALYLFCFSATYWLIISFWELDVQVQDHLFSMSLKFLCQGHRAGLRWATTDQHPWGERSLEDSGKRKRQMTKWWAHKRGPWQMTGRTGWTDGEEQRPLSFYWRTPCGSLNKTVAP